MKLCNVCDKPLVGKQIRFCCTKCKNAANQTYIAQQKRATERKIKYVNQLGGCCSSCGYDHNLASLTFHHIDPSTKSFGLDARSLSNRTIAKIEAEVKKCTVLCENCHRTLHNPHLSNWKIVGPVGFEPTLSRL